MVGIRKEWFDWFINLLRNNETGKMIFFYWDGKMIVLYAICIFKSGDRVSTIGLKKVSTRWYFSFQP